MSWSAPKRSLLAGPLRSGLRAGMSLVTRIEQRLPAGRDPDSEAACVSDPATGAEDVPLPGKVGPTESTPVSDQASHSTGGRSTRDRPRLFLLNPPPYRGAPAVRLFRTECLYLPGNVLPPMDLAYFVAVVGDQTTVELLDANVEGLSQDQVVQRMEDSSPDVLVVKGVLNILEHDLEAARRYKEQHPQVQVVLSCRGAVEAEDELFAEFPFLDGLARGEIDAFAQELVDGLPLHRIGGMSVPGARSSKIRIVQDLDAHPIPAFEALPDRWGKGYTMPYQGVTSGYALTASRGCPYTCTFCMVGGIADRPFRFRKRSPDNVVEEVRAIRRHLGVGDVYFWDEIINMPAHGRRLAQALASSEESVAWACEAKPDLARAEDLRLFREAGCFSVFYGIESGDDGVLRDIQKGHTAEQAARAIRLTREAGLLAGAFLIFGFPNDSLRTFLHTVRFVLDAQPDMVRYSTLLPYPTTTLFAEMQQAGLLSFERSRLDRKLTGSSGDETVPYGTHKLGPRSLRLADFMIRQLFTEQLNRIPAPPGPAA